MCILFQISLKPFSKGSTDNKSALVQAITQDDDNSLHEPIKTKFNDVIQGHQGPVSI